MGQAGRYGGGKIKLIDLINVLKVSGPIFNILKNIVSIFTPQEKEPFAVSLDSIRNLIQLNIVKGPEEIYYWSSPAKTGEKEMLGYKFTFRTEKDSFFRKTKRRIVVRKSSGEIDLYLMHNDSKTLPHH